MANPSQIAELARQTVFDAEKTFANQAHNVLYGEIQNLIAFAVKGGYFSDVITKEGTHRRSEQEILESLLQNLADALPKVCQQLYERTRHRFVECFHLSASDFEAQEAEIAKLKSRLTLRNRQIRDLRRQLHK